MSSEHWESDRRSGAERRKDGEPGHVSIESLSVGITDRLDRVEGKFDTAVLVGGKLAKIGVGLIVAVLGGLFGLGVWYQKINSSIQNRPTIMITQSMVDSARAEFTEELAKNSAADQVRADALLNNVVEFRLIIEQNTNEISALRRDYERVHGKN